MNESMANIILNKVIETGEVVSRVVEKLDNLVVTVDEHHDLIVETRDDVKTIVSKQNADYTYFVKDKEKMLLELNARIEPLEREHKKRSEFATDVKKKSWDTIWDWAKIGIVFGAGYLLTIIRKI